MLVQSDSPGKHSSCWECPSCCCWPQGCSPNAFFVFPPGRSDRARWMAALMHREKENPDTTPKGGTLCQRAAWLCWDSLGHWSICRPRFLPGSAPLLPMERKTPRLAPRGVASHEVNQSQLTLNTFPGRHSGIPGMPSAVVRGGLTGLEG